MVPFIGSEDAQQLYKCIRRLFDLPEHLARYDAPIGMWILVNGYGGHARH